MVIALILLAFLLVGVFFSSKDKVNTLTITTFLSNIIVILGLAITISFYRNDLNTLAQQHRDEKNSQIAAFIMELKYNQTIYYEMLEIEEDISKIIDPRFEYSITKSIFLTGYLNKENLDLLWHIYREMKFVNNVLEKHTVLYLQPRTPVPSALNEIYPRITEINSSIETLLDNLGR